LLIIGLDIFYVMWGLPETKVKEDFPFEWKRANPFRCFYVLIKNKFVFGVSLIYFFAFLGEAGILDTVVLFLKYKFHFEAFEIGVALSILGFCFILQGLLIRLIIPRFGERKTSLFALGIDVVTAWMYGSIPADMPYLLLILFALRALALMTGPSLQGMISRQYNKSMQGEVLAVLAALRNLTLFLGPLIFNNLFAYYISEDAKPYKIPGIVYFVDSIIWLICFVAAVVLYRWIPEEDTLKEEYKRTLLSESDQFTIEDEANSDNILELEENPEIEVKKEFD